MAESRPGRGNLWDDFGPALFESWTARKARLARERAGLVAGPARRGSSGDLAEERATVSARNAMIVDRVARGERPIEVMRELGVSRGVVQGALWRASVARRESQP